ncbi:zinc ribbon domain-containing protein [Saccharibacillus sacchari]|uniref:Zinc ribbon domain-containing protein n=1 Tax=Saccharibacillus sacchari TaxID=456493 RepID=A0ACC6PHF7_9BACL
MYCNKCGAKQPENAAFCFSCGNRLNTGVPGRSVIDLRKKTKQAESPTTSVPPVLPSILLSGDNASAEAYRYPETKPSFFARHGSWFALAVLVLLIVGGVYGWNAYTGSIDAQTAKLRSDAEAFARDGDYPAASDSLRQASELIRSDASLDAELALIDTAASVQGQLRQASEHISSGKLDEAERVLASVETELGERASALLEREKTSFLRQKDQLAVLRIGEEAGKLDNVTALVPLLDKLERVDTDESEAVRAAIVAQIVGLSSDQAAALLQSGSFASAAQAVEQGLKYAPADSGLLKLNGEIESAKTAAADREKAEAAQAAEAKRLAEAEANKRIEQAAAREEAELAVQSFYGNIATQNYGGAYALLGANWQKGTGYSAFVSGYDNTYDVWLDSIDSAQNGENVQVTIVLTAWESSEFGMVYSTYRSVYQVGYENGTMKILSGKGEKLS